MGYNRGQLVANHPRPNHNSAVEYQGSCIPFVTSSDVGTDVIKVGFPRVTRFIVVSNRHGSQTLSFGFTENGTSGAKGPYSKTGTNDNFFTLAAGQVTERLEIKCTGIFLKGSGATTTFSLLAGMTNVEPSMFLNLTGSDGWQGVG
jgi:hypothetical protein